MKKGIRICTGSIAALVLLSSVSSIVAQASSLPTVEIDGTAFQIYDPTGRLNLDADGNPPADSGNFYYLYADGITDGMAYGKLCTASLHSAVYVTISKSDETDALIDDARAALRDAFGYQEGQPAQYYSAGISAADNAQSYTLFVEDELLRADTPDKVQAFLADIPALDAQVTRIVYYPAAGEFNSIDERIYSNTPVTFMCSPEPIDTQMEEYIAANSLPWQVDRENHTVIPETWTTDATLEILGTMLREFGCGVLPSTADAPGEFSAPAVLLRCAPGSGDVTADGRVNIADAIALTQYNTEVADCGVTEEGLANADVNADGEINADDVSALLEKLANLSA